MLCWRFQALYKIGCHLPFTIWATFWITGDHFGRLKAGFSGYFVSPYRCKISRFTIGRWIIQVVARLWSMYAMHSTCTLRYVTLRHDNLLQSIKVTGSSRTATASLPFRSNSLELLLGYKWGMKIGRLLDYFLLVFWRHGFRKKSGKWQPCHLCQVS